MTAHLVVADLRPKNEAEFDRAYREEHLPYAGPRLVGAAGVTTKRVVGPGLAPPFHLVSDVTVPSIEALQTCAPSRSGQETLEHAASISTGGAPKVLVVVDLA